MPKRKPKMRWFFSPLLKKHANHYPSLPGNWYLSAFAQAAARTERQTSTYLAWPKIGCLAPVGFSGRIPAEHFTYLVPQNQSIDTFELLE